MLLTHFLISTLATLAVATPAKRSLSPAWQAAVAAAPAACSSACSVPAIKCSISSCTENSDGMIDMCGAGGQEAVEECNICLSNENAITDQDSLDIQELYLSSCLGPSYTTLIWSTSVLNGADLITNGLNTGSVTGSPARPTTTGTVDTRSAGDGEGDLYTRTPTSSPSASNRQSSTSGAAATAVQTGDGASKPTGAADAAAVVSWGAVALAGVVGFLVV